MLSNGFHRGLICPELLEKLLRPGKRDLPVLLVVLHQRLTSSGSPILWLDQVLSDMVWTSLPREFIGVCGTYVVTYPLYS